MAPEELRVKSPNVELLDSRENVTTPLRPESASAARRKRMVAGGDVLSLTDLVMMFPKRDLSQYDSTAVTE